MFELKSVRTRVALPRCRLCRISLVRVYFVLTAIACISSTAFGPIDANAQQAIPQQAGPMAITAPFTPPSAATHLVIEPPQPLKHHGSARHRTGHHELPQIVMPMHQESVGGGYWNQTGNSPESIHSVDEMGFEGQFADAELPPPGPPKKKIDLTHAFPSHAHKTPRSTAIPQASRTTGWKQPYSYGHFGAKHNRQWSVHHGHQRSHTQWTFR